MNNLLDRKSVLRVGSVGTFKARAEDYTPNAENRQRLPGLESPPSGGADEFLAFIEHELKLLIAKLYTVEVRRQALFGHSYCGLFTLYTLLTKSQAFQGCGRQSVDLVVQGLSRTHARSVRTAARRPACRRAHGRHCPAYGRPSAAAFQPRSAQRIPVVPGANHGTNAAHSSIVALALAAAIPRSGRVRMAKATRTDRSAG
ncbi:alpha/beta hydrolase-fold protein [Stutzerimonas stutzeri]|uniref:alpha/beta hydrolase-fold protein n=1 Tax=Stutzerimonas stutzeri TaxID=316 RepID=UPI002108F3BC|nr:alpha/beta hydrolase-fold protein [Stutzerimonas stutzeri]